jgi:hypothetical protein
MTPDTTSFMIAGLAVIYIGILLYILSLWWRSRRHR